MKYLKKTILFALTISILCITFYSLYIPVCASEHGGGGGTNHGQLTEEEKRLKKLEILDNIEKYLLFLCSEIGVYFNGSSYSDFYKNYVDYEKSTNDKWFENNVSVSDDGNAVFSKTLISSLKAFIDKYAKEHEPYYMVNTLTLDDFKGNNQSGSHIMYFTVKNLLSESSSGVIAFGANYLDPTNMFFVDIGNDFKKISPVKYNNNYDRVNFYSNETWNQVTYKAYKVELEITDNAIETASEFKEKAASTYDYGNSTIYVIGNTFNVYFGNNDLGLYPYHTVGPTGRLWLVANNKRRIRVFNTYGDFQNYTLGQRSVYYTSKYYEYVPDDLTVSIDDLQKEIDDLQKVIDELLDRITERTDESEIEELLRQILEALRNQQSTGGGGSGGGDVTVNVDMKETNSWLSKIYTKVSEISSKLSSSAGQSMDEVVDAIENLCKKLSMDELKASIEDLGNMLKKYLKEITGDLDDIKGQLAEMTEQEFSDKTDSFLDESTESFSEIAEVAKTKFPFSLPNDLRILISKMALPSSEAEAALYSVDTSGISLYSDGEHGGGGGSRPPSSGFVSVEHGGGGGSRGSAEMKDGAPVFYLPIVIERYGIEEYIIVNMAPFEPVSKLSRTLFAIMFMLCLFNLTFKTMGLWGDLVG